MLKKFFTSSTILFLLIQFIFGTGLLLFPEKHVEATGNTYYVDNTITDTNHSSCTPDLTTYNHSTFETTGGADSVFATISDINTCNSSQLPPGSNIFFRKGQTWREQLVIPTSGSVGNPITYGAFGSGANPVVSGAVLATPWSAFTVSGSVTLTNTHLSIVNGTAFADLTGVDLTPYLNAKLTVTDSSGKKLIGYIKAVGGGEALSGTELATGWTNNSSYPFDTLTTSGSNITSAISLATGGRARIPQLSSPDGKLFKWTQNVTLNSGGVPYTFYSPDSGIGDYVLANGSGARTKYFTGSSDHTYVGIRAYTAPTNFSATGFSLQQVTAPSTTGVTIVSTQGGSTYSWTSEDSGFNRRDSSGYTYLIEPQAQNIWKATVTTQPHAVWFDGVLGSKQTSTLGLTAQYDWYWLNNSLYVYAVASPDTVYTNSGVEAGVIGLGTDNAVIESNGKSYINIQSVDVIHGNYNNIALSDSGSTGATGITLQNLTTSNAADNGILITMDGVTVDSITSTHNGSSNLDHGIYGSSSGAGASNYIIRNSIFSLNVGAGVHLYGGTESGTGSGTVTHNYITQNGTYGILASLLSASSVVDLVGNIVFNNGQTGIRSSDLSANSKLHVYNNTIVNNTDYGIWTSNEDLATEIILKNNIIYGNARSVVQTNSVTPYTIDYNIYYLPSNELITYNGAHYSIAQFGAYKTATGQDAHSSYINPLLSNIAGNDLSLQASSPAIDSGLNLGSSYTNGLDVNSAWPNSVTTLDQSLRGVSWEIGAYVYSVPEAPLIGSPTAQSSSSIRWNFTDNASDESGFRIYDNTNTLATSSVTANLTYLDEIGLSENTQYSGRYVTAYNSYGNSASSPVASAIYTLADTPTNFSASSNSNSVTLSVDGFPNDTSGQSGYYFSRSGGGNSGWIQTNSWTDSGLSCGHEYTYSVKYRNGDGTNTSEISTTKSTSGCGGGGSPAMWTLPSVPQSGFKLSINNGALTTSNRNVILGFNAGADIKKMAISMTGDFTDASQEDYSASKQWDLCSKLGGAIKNPTCPDGIYKVYAQFYTVYGRSSNAAVTSSAIVLKSGIANPNVGTDKNPSTQTTGQFTLVLKYGSNNTQVLWLQNLLKTLGFFPANVIPNGNFGPVTKQAVQKFQCANKLVCSGNERTTGYGQVGPKTRRVLNSQNH